MSDINADYYCRKCGDKLSADEFGYDECDACAYGKEPWECFNFYCDEVSDDC
jgi:Zn finger protein HypA/HybF involved in hydrogenase expression